MPNEKVAYDSGKEGDTVEATLLSERGLDYLITGVIIKYLDPPFPYLIRYFDQRQMKHETTIISREEVRKINNVEVIM